MYAYLILKESTLMLGKPKFKSRNRDCKILKLVFCFYYVCLLKTVELNWYKRTEINTLIH